MHLGTIEEHALTASRPSSRTECLRSAVASGGPAREAVGTPSPPAPFISIVIPALDECTTLGRTLEHLRTLPGRFEVLVVDGGSQDGTVEIARSNDVRVLRSARGRGPQMNRGAAAAAGDVLVFLHADTLLPEDFAALVRAALGDPDVRGGCFRLGFDRDGATLRLLAWMTRFSLPLVHYGDQAFFVRRGVFSTLGGYRPFPIMEDLDFWRRLRRSGRVRVLDQAVTTSGRRFARHGAIRQSCLNAVLVMLYLLGARPSWLAGMYGVVREAPVEGTARDRFKRATPSSRMRRTVRTLWHWVRSNAHNAYETCRVLGFMLSPRVRAGMLEPDHPWVTGTCPRSGESVWPRNIVFASPRRREWKGRTPDDDEAIMMKVGRFIAEMVARSNRVPEIAHGPSRRMPHAVNYLHGAIHCNAGWLIFDDFSDAMYYLSDGSFVAEIRRFARVEKRELMIVLRERVYDPTEYAWFVAFVRSHLPWYANGNGPTKRPVLWGTPSPYAVVNPINGAWVHDMARFVAGERASIVRPCIDGGRYFRDHYRGDQPEYTFLEKFHAWAISRIIRARGFQGGLLFTPRRRIEPRRWEQYERTRPAWTSSHAVPWPGRARRGSDPLG